jgi:hypothetical protein
MEQLCKYATVLEPLLSSCPRATTEVLLEAVFSMDPLRDYTTRQTELNSVNGVSAVQRIELVCKLENCCCSVIVSCCCEKLVAEARG